MTSGKSKSAQIGPARAIKSSLYPSREKQSFTVQQRASIQLKDSLIIFSENGGQNARRR